MRVVEKWARVRVDRALADMFQGGPEPYVRFEAKAFCMKHGFPPETLDRAPIKTDGADYVVEARI